MDEGKVSDIKEGGMREGGRKQKREKTERGEGKVTVYRES